MGDDNLATYVVETTPGGVRNETPVYPADETREKCVNLDKSSVPQTTIAGCGSGGGDEETLPAEREATATCLLGGIDGVKVGLEGVDSESEVLKQSVVVACMNQISEGGAEKLAILPTGAAVDVRPGPNNTNLAAGAEKTSPLTAVPDEQGTLLTTIAIGEERETQVATVLPAGVEPAASTTIEVSGSLGTSIPTAVEAAEAVTGVAAPGSLDESGKTMAIESPPADAQIDSCSQVLTALLPQCQN